MQKVDSEPDGAIRSIHHMFKARQGSSVDVPEVTAFRWLKQLVKSGTLLLALAGLLGSGASTCADEKTALIQDFEEPFQITKWPPDHPGSIDFSSEWRVDGERSLKIDAGLMAALSALKRHDWRTYSLLRFRVYNPTQQTVRVGFELQDQHTQFHERHQNGFGVLPGVQVVEMDLAGGLWRGEENRSYRGKIMTPIDLEQITRLAFFNQGPGSIYIDQVELVRVPLLKTAGGFAFDFGRTGASVMFQTTGVGHTSRYTGEKGYGLLEEGRALGRSTSYPTPLLGDGVALPEEGFRVNLPGGDYLGWIAFERGGFWRGEYCGYTEARLKHNGQVVHAHSFSPAGMHFLFQDVELTSMDQLAKKLIWPAHAVHTFRFEAVEGANLFQLETEGAVHSPLRIAGLILAPARPEGKAFIAAHEELQRRVISRTFAPQDRSRRGEGHLVPAADLVVQPLPVGHLVYPRDWPTRPQGAVPEEITAVAGQQVTVHLGVFARREWTLDVAVEPLRGPETLVAPLLAYGRYLPMRPYGVGTTWLEVNHYRPESHFTVGPELSRSLIVECDIPPDTPAGLYRSSIRFVGDGVETKVPIRIRVIAVELEPIPIPVGLFMNALPISPELLDEETWWRLQESLLAEQVRAGLNCLTGGSGLSYQVAQEEGKIEIRGESARRYIQMAMRYGPIRAIVPYGGFLPHLRHLDVAPRALASVLRAFETEHGLPPHYVYAYDEPSTEEEMERVLAWLEPAADSGLRTIGYTSWHEDDVEWQRLIKVSYAPALNLHTGEQLRLLTERGLHPWVYNNGLSRPGLGLRLWRSMRLGAKGRLQWIGLFTQGFAFHNLDGREPSLSCFLVHQKFGVLKTPLWLGSREGLLDLRLRLTLEKYAEPDDPALQLWSLDGYREDEEEWNEERLNGVRTRMLARLEQLVEK